LNLSKKRRIELVAASYDLSTDESAWLVRIAEAAAPLLDGGFGTLAVSGSLSTSDATFSLDGFAGPNELLQMQSNVLAELPKPVVVGNPRTGIRFVSEQNEESPEALRLWRRHLGSATDALKLVALDTDLRMLYFFAPTAGATAISHGEKAIWRMLTAHLSSGLRLRRSLRAQGSPEASPERALPHGADAVIDPRSFSVTDAAGPARSKSASMALREASVRVDRGRAEADSDDAFIAWQALVQARWSMVDWFDTDGRRYILAIPNEPDTGDPRMLTKRESQVAAYAAIGENHKLIAFRLGISRARVSVHLRSIMQKLGAQTQAQLVANLSPFARAFASEPSTNSAQDS
jgi:DNA-binding CsgD family transcriptional regulator